MKKYIILIVILFISCSQVDNCPYYSPEQETTETITLFSCCDGSIIETGFIEKCKNITYSHNTRNCGECGNICPNGCLCYQDNFCECTGEK